MILVFLVKIVIFTKLLMSGNNLLELLIK